MKYRIETIFGAIKKWFSRKRSGPGLAEAERSREQTRRIAPYYRNVVGGVDEPDLLPLTRGERLHPFMAADGSFNTDPLVRARPFAGRRVRDRIVCKCREINN
ncbi:MAG: hypothetical protein AAF085_12500 [Planctomycetota bacterium]